MCTQVWPALMDIPNRQIWKQKTNPVASAEAADTPVEGYKAMEVYILPSTPLQPRPLSFHFKCLVQLNVEFQNIISIGV